MGRTAPLLVLVSVLVCAPATFAALEVLAAAGPPTSAGLELTGHPRAAEIRDSLDRGFVARWVRLYQEAQRMAGEDQPEPARLALTDRRGGFPRIGFRRDGREHPDSGVVELHHSMPLHGRFGAMDQIFAHELAHLVLWELTGEMASGPSARLHGIALRTDRATAFQEGFAAHVQGLVVDDPDADPRTAALASDGRHREWLEAALTDYSSELTAAWSVATPARVTVPLRQGRVEQTLRYFGVREGWFGRTLEASSTWPAERRLRRERLLESIAIPGQGRRRSRWENLAVEGVVATFFRRWVEDPAFRSRSPAGRGSADEVYLKIFRAIRESGARDLVALLDAYRRIFPAEEGDLRRLADHVLGGWPLPAPPEIWLDNPEVLVGLGILDQFTVLETSHRFDLNAASPADLTALAGVDRDLAERILQSAPFFDRRQVERIDGVPTRLERYLLRFGPSASVEGASIGVPDLVSTLLWGLGVRLVTLYGFASLLAGMMFRMLAGGGRREAVAPALLASLVVFLFSWIVGNGWTALVMGGLLVGLPAAMRRARRRSGGRSPAWIAAGWVAAGVPACLLVVPLF